MREAVEVVVPPGAEHPEGPAWDAATARLWWVDIAGRRVHCLDPVEGADTSWSLAEEPGGVVLDEHGVPVVALPEGLGRLDRDRGTVELVLPIEAELPGNRSNDLKVDGRGRIWMGTMDRDQHAPQGALYRVEAGLVDRVVAGLTVSNGPALHEAAGRMYLADTGARAVYVFDLDPATGRLGERRSFLDFRSEDLLPDGMTVDDAGFLWLALGRSATVRRYDPEGRLASTVPLPTSNPTSVAFGGADEGELFITTSRVDVDPARRADEPLAGAVFRFRPGVTGPGSPRCRLPAVGRPARGSRLAGSRPP